MKIALKVLALFLIFAVTVVSLPMVGFVPKAETESQSQVDTYTFKFDGEDEYNFYESDYTGTDGAPSIKNNYTVDAVAKSSFSTATNPKQTSTNAAAVLGDSAASKVGVISAPAKSGDTALTGHEIGDFVSPDAAIFDKAKSEDKTLISGSFDLCTSRKGSYTPIFVFGQNDSRNYLFRIGAANTGGLDYLYHAEYGLTFDKYKVNAAKNNGMLKGTSIGDESWFHYEFSYGADGRLTVTVSNGSIENTFTSSNSIPEKDRYFALTTALCTAPNNANRPVYFDNVVLNFAPYDKAAVEKKENAVVYDFEDDRALVADAFSSHAHANNNVTHNIATNGGMQGISGNHTYHISKSTAVTGATNLKTGNMSQIISPEKAVFTEKANEGKYLVSGSFDLWFRDPSRYNAVLVFGYDETNKNFQYALVDGDQRGNFYSKEYSADFENETTNTNQSYLRGVFNTAFGNCWLHFEYVFDNENNLNLAVSDKNGKYVTYKFTIPVEKENRIFGIAKAYSGNSREIHIDNVVMNFADSTASVNDEAYNKLLDAYLNKLSTQALELDANRIAPYDFEEINKLVTKFDEACEKVPSIKNDTFFTELSTKLPVYKKNIEAWGDISTDVKLAEGFYNLYFNKSEVDYPLAFSIYRRLTKSQRTAFSTAYADEFAAMNNAVVNGEAELLDGQDQIRITTVGDSITEGVGASNKGTTSYPGQLLSLLNANDTKFTINNQGNAGKRVAIHAAKDDMTVIEGEYRFLHNYYNVVNSKPDIITVMLGTNDLANPNADNKRPLMTDGNGNLLPERYAQYKKVYTDLIQSLMSIEGSPQIVIMTVPVSNGIGNDKDWIDRTTAMNKLYKEVAAEYDIPVFDMFTFTLENLVGSDFRDAWHPVDSGYTKMAKFMFDSLNEYTFNDTAAAFTMTKKVQIKGDANGDGKCNIADLLRVQKFVSNVTDAITTSNVDFDSNGQIDALDYNALCKYLLDLI